MRAHEAGHTGTVVPASNATLTERLHAGPTVAAMTDRRVVSQVLRRVTFGPTAAEVDAVAGTDPGKIVTALLAPAPPPRLPDLGPDPYTALAARPTKEDRQRARRAAQDQMADATWWWLTRMAGCGAPEKLTFFWHGHWATSAQKVRSAGLMLGQQQTFRRYGGGETGPLVRAMLRDPALIIWLDGQRSSRTAPNENLARELMELFTLGVGHYGEDDVKAAAKVLTGWQVDRAAGTAKLVARRHDDSPVTLLGHRGTLDVDGLADLLVRHPAHVPFLASRIWARYGSGEPAPVATLRRLIVKPAWFSFCAMTATEASGSRKRWRMTWRTTSSVRRWSDSSSSSSSR